MVSIARPLISGEGHRLLSELVGYVEEMQKTYGWYNMPPISATEKF